MTKEQRLLEEFYYTMKALVETKHNPRDIERGINLLKEYENLSWASFHQTKQDDYDDFMMKL